MADTKQNKIDLYEELRSSILTLQLEPGADLDETSLSKKFGLSRTPLREVLQQLSGEGFVELRENRGARVSDMSYKTLRSFFLTAPMIYGAVLQLAAANAKPAQIEALKKAQLDFESALRNGTATARALANNRFHEITGAMAANVYLLPSFRRLLVDHARIGMTFYKPQNNEMAKKLSEASDQHIAIISAIEQGDTEKAAQLATRHWNLSRNQIEQYVMPDGLDNPLGLTAHNTA